MILKIANGNLILPNGVKRANLYVKDGFISEISTKDKKFDRLIDATNSFVFPGLIDAHTHLSLQQGEHHTAGDFQKSAALAASQGITSVIDYLPQDTEEIPVNGAFVNYSFHKVITTPVNYKYINGYVAKGITSFKIFTTYSKNGWMLNDGQIRDLMFHVKRAGAILEVHCENDGMVKENLRHMPPVIENLSKIREPLCELEAVNRMCFLAMNTGVHLHIVHTTLPASWTIINNYRKKGAKITWETCPQYLFLHDMLLERNDNYLYTFAPPLRDKDAMTAMRALVLKGKADIITTDHCAFTKDQKLSSKDISRIPMGLPSIGFSFRLILELFDNPKNFNKAAALLSLNPAKLFGIKKRGALKRGFHADIAIIKEISSRPMELPSLSLSGANPYSHVNSRWRVINTLVNGEIAWQDGDLKHLAGHFLKRAI